jgi:hypothetical protein
MHVCMCVYVSMYVCLCMYLCVYVRMYVCMYVSYFSSLILQLKHAPFLEDYSLVHIESIQSEIITVRKSQ